MGPGTTSPATSPIGSGSRSDHARARRCVEPTHRGPDRRPRRRPRRHPAAGSRNSRCTRRRLHPPRHHHPARSSSWAGGSCCRRRRGAPRWSRARSPSRPRRSWTTWRSGTTCCTDSGTGCEIRGSTPPPGSGTSSTPAALWKRSHNEGHHVYTNIVGLDNDLGYGIMRVDEAQPWQPRHLVQPVVNLLNAGLRVRHRGLRPGAGPAPPG